MHILNILHRVSEIRWLIISRISLCIPLGPVPLCGLSCSISRNTSLGVQGSNANDLELRSGKYLSKVLSIGVLFFSRMLSATVVKYWLKLLHISLLSVTMSLSTSMQLGAL